MHTSETVTLPGACAGLEIPEEVREFRHTSGTRVVFGTGLIGKLGACAREFGDRALLVTDQGIVRTGFVTQARRSLEQAGIAVTVADDVHPNPTTIDVEKCVALARAADINLLIGMGGGSSMDAAKGCNFIYTNGGKMRDYWGRDKAAHPMLPLIAIPTTAGTGSECQSYALISDPVTHHKMACGDSKAAARLALLDPELTLTQPATVTANTVIDALSHAVESYVSNARTGISCDYARSAFALLRAGLDAVVNDPDDLLGRARLQLAAAMAGTAIENSMLGAAHSAANPLTARFDTIHGQAVGVVLPAVVRMNARRNDAVAKCYRQLYPDGALDTWIEDKLRAFGLQDNLTSLGVDRAAIPQMAAEAAEQWTAQFNPVKVGAEEFVRLYEDVFEKRTGSEHLTSTGRLE